MAMAAASAIVGPLIGMVANVGTTLIQRNIPNNTDKKFTPEGLANLVEITLLNFMDPGTLLGLSKHSFTYYPPHLFQGLARDQDNQGHEDLATLDDEMVTIMGRICDKDYSAKEVADLKYIVELTIEAFQILNKSYENNYLKKNKPLYDKISRYIQKCIDVLNRNIDPETVTYTESNLDKRMRESHRTATSLSFIADTLKTIKDPKTSRELKDSSIGTLTTWAGMRILKFEAIEKEVLKRA